MEYFINCNTSPLSPVSGNLSKSQVSHLYRRLGFSASAETITSGTNQTANALINSLISEATNLAPIAAPTWANWNNSDYSADDDLAGQEKRAQQDELSQAYANSLLDNNLRDRLSFFWSNHFVTEIDVYDCNSFLYEYVNCLQRNAIGNFRTFVSEIGLTSAMLFYLDGVYNNNNNPNENYGRELYELFTLGEGNAYTEQDIIETSRALTGYVERGELGCEKVAFATDKHDTGSKTILGQTGNWDYDDVIDILFTERANEVAEFICRKLYEFFVHPDSKDAANNAQTIITGMAATFVSNSFEIAPVLSQLFKSQHFYDEDAVGVIIKSPYDLYFNLVKETGFSYNNTTVASLINYSGLLSQRLFDPVDVAGWQRNRSWINTNFMIGRWLTLETILEGFYQDNDEQFRNFAIEAVGTAESNTSNPETVVRAIVNKITPKGLLTPQDFDNAMSAFKTEDVPESYYSPDYVTGGTSQWILNISQLVPNQVYLLLVHLSRQPEFQLK